MAHNIGMYCGPDDSKKLIEFIRSIQLNLIPLQVGQEIGKPDEIYGLYLSPLKQEELVPYGDPPISFAPTVNPVFEMRRPYYKNNFLVTGFITLETYPKDIYTLLKPYYMKIYRWIRKNYRKYGDFYVGFEAQELIKNGASKTSAQI